MFLCPAFLFLNSKLHTRLLIVLIFIVALFYLFLLAVDLIFS